MSYSKKRKISKAYDFLYDKLVQLREPERSRRGSQICNQSLL